MALWRNILNSLVWIVCVWLLSVFIHSDYWKNRPYINIQTPADHTDVVIVVAGDLISHQDVQRAAIDAENGWVSLWEEITPIFKKADLAIANLETPIAPNTGKPGIPFCFNAPKDLASALKVTGIDLVITANNHAFDQSVAGVAETLTHLNANEVRYIGSGNNRFEAQSPITVELPGDIKVALLARTDLFNNNLNASPDRPWVAALDLDADEKIVKELRPQVDAIIFSVHWGNEYHAKPSVRQRDVAKRLIAAGVDVIAGHHPHVLQPFEWVESGERKGAVAFSLGNFLSNQHRMYNPAIQSLSEGENRDGGLLMITLRKDRSGTSLHDAKVEPVWTDNNWIEHNQGRNAKRVIRVMQTTPGKRGTEMELLLSKRRVYALERLGYIVSN